MKLVWTQKALRQLQNYEAWLNTLENANIPQTMRRIQEAAQSLERLGDIGRPGQARGTRELSVRLAPYVLIFMIDQELITILGVYHMAQGKRDW